MKECKWCGKVFDGYMRAHRHYPRYKLGLWDGKSECCTALCKMKYTLWYECRVIEREKEQRRQRLMPQ